MKVTTQAELDEALAKKGYTEIIIDSPRGVWLTINSNDGKYVEASGSATVRASGSATVRAYDSATVRAYDSATVRAYDSATVRASGSATVEASGSATVEASGSATVRAYDSATVRAYDSATVRAYDSATVRAYDSATVRASGSATVEASGSATVEASGSATVRASKYVAIHLHSVRVTVNGGVVIDVSKIDTNTVQNFIDYHGTEVVDGYAVVYKAVDSNLKSGRGFAYPIGETVTAEDWKPSAECGNGLHFGHRPHVARTYFPQATRFLECRVAVDGLVALGDKVKSRSAVVVREVDIDGDPV